MFTQDFIDESYRFYRMTKNEYDSLRFFIEGKKFPDDYEDEEIIKISYSIAEKIK